jgi:type I restriction enzyme S subunit
MAKWKKTYIGQFLKEREGRYSPDDKKLAGLERLNKIDFSGKIHLSDKSSKTNMIIVEPGDLVISGINVSKGAIAVYQGDKPITATIHYSSYEFDEDKIDIEYFKRFVKSKVFIQALEVRGGIKTEIKPKHFLPIELDLPDVEEQQEIVSFFRRVENEIGELGSETSKQARYLDMLRQAVLQEAIEGKLTVGWRKQNPKLVSGENHASKLLEEILAEKSRLIEEGEIRKEKPLSRITDEEKPFPLPVGWAWCRLGHIIRDLPRNGYSPREVNYETRTKNLKLGATTYGVFDPSKFKYVKDEIPEDSSFWLEPGDILIQRGNSRDYVGVSAVYTGSPKEFIYPDLMMKIKVMQPLDPVMIHRWLLSPMIRMYFRTKAKGAQKTMPKIKQGIVTNTVLPMPPYSEHEVLMKKISIFMQIIDELSRQISDRRGQSEQLMQTVLREAFEPNHA